MNERLQMLKDRVRAGEQKRFRQASGIDILAECEREHLSWMQRAARLVRRQCEAERVVIEPDKRIVFTRTLPDIPVLYDPQSWEKLFAGHTKHEAGPVNNICAD